MKKLSVFAIDASIQRVDFFGTSMIQFGQSLTVPEQAQFEKIVKDPTLQQSVLDALSSSDYQNFDVVIILPDWSTHPSKLDANMIALLSQQGWVRMITPVTEYGLPVTF